MTALFNLLMQLKHNPERKERLQTVHCLNFCLVVLTGVVQAALLLSYETAELIVLAVVCTQAEEA